MGKPPVPPKPQPPSSAQATPQVQNPAVPVRPDGVKERATGFIQRPTEGASQNQSDPATNLFDALQAVKEKQKAKARDSVQAWGTLARPEPERISRISPQIWLICSVTLIAGIGVWGLSRMLDSKTPGPQIANQALVPTSNFAGHSPASSTQWTSAENAADPSSSLAQKEAARKRAEQARRDADKQREEERRIAAQREADRKEDERREQERREDERRREEYVRGSDSGRDPYDTLQRQGAMDRNPSSDDGAPHSKPSSAPNPEGPNLQGSQDQSAQPENSNLGVPID